MENKQLFKIAEKFRTAIVNVPKNKFRTSLGCAEFSNACCDDASLLLAAFLSDRGFKGSSRVSGIDGGNEGELCTHVWLSYSNFIIDITADQFLNYKEPPVLVAFNSRFHRSFKIENIEPADFRVKFANDLICLSNFTHDYEILLKKIIA